MTGNAFLDARGRYSSAGGLNAPVQLTVTLTSKDAVKLKAL